MIIGRRLIKTFRRYPLKASIDEYDYDLASVLTKETPTVDLSFNFPFRHAPYRSIRHLKLKKGFLLAYLSH